MPSEAYNFVSLVGRNPMGIRQPFCACLEHMGLPKAVHLLVTPSVQTSAKGIVHFMREFGLSEKNIYCHEIAEFSDLQPNCLNAEKLGLPSATALIAKLSAQEAMAWNINGGTNAAQAACLLALQGENHKLVQTTHDSFSCSFLNKKEKDIRLPLPAAMPVSDLLRFNDIKWKDLPERKSSLRDLAYKYKLSLPQNSLSCVEVGGFFFDLIWNAGDNVLRFMLFWESNAPSENAPSEKVLAKARELLTFALGKESTTWVFDRYVYVVGPPSKQMERFHKEGRYKLQSIVLNDNHSNTKDRDTKDRDTKDRLNKCLAPALTTPPKSGALPKVNLALHDDSTLVMFLPPDPSIALVALATHKPRHVVLCHTESDANMRKAIDAMKKAKERLLAEQGLESMEFVLSTYDAQDIRRRLPALGNNVTVNCTPGTKGQGIHLALWAKENGAAVWVMDQITKFAHRLDADADRLPMQQPTLRTMLHICVQAEIDDYGWGKNSQDWQDNWYDQMLTCMQKTSGEGANFEACHNRRTLWKGRTKEKCGKRFERLVTKAVAAIGEDVDVAQGVNCIRKVGNGQIYDQAKHRMTEIDVLATYAGHLFMISCKAKSLSPEEYKNACKEAIAVAKTLGRFVTPVLCCLDASENATEEGVLLIDWHVLPNPAKLAGELVKAAKLYAEQ